MILGVKWLNTHFIVLDSLGNGVTHHKSMQKNTLFLSHLALIILPLKTVGTNTKYQTEIYQVLAEV